MITILFFLAAAIMFVLMFNADRKEAEADSNNDYQMANYYNSVSFKLALFGMAFLLAFFITLIV